MVKLVAVCRDDEDYPYESRQLTVNVDKSLTLVLQLENPLQSGYKNKNAKYELRNFIENYNILNVEEVKQACMMNGKDLSTFLSHMVPCVGCRRSVEQMFIQLADQGHPALDPLFVTSHRTMFIKRTVSSNPTALYKLFYHDVFHMYNLIENILKNKKNKRCFIHSLEMQKPRLGRALAMSPNTGQACTNLSSLPPAQPANIPYYGNGTWMDIWNDLSNDCKEEVVILDCEGILDLMEDYLKRHRFCKDCKSKVARAFGILVDEIDPKNEAGYCSALYVGLRFCGPKSKLDLEKIADEEEEEEEGEEETHEHEKDEEEEVDTCFHEHEDEDECYWHDADAQSGDIGPDGEVQDKEMLDKATETSGGNATANHCRHIHVCCETNYIAHLMTRAEAEISGGRRERHAKSIDVAQEEVLTCISLYLYERLHKLWRKVKAESQTWRVLFYVSVETMRRVFEIVVEEKVGMGKLEALCEEFEMEDRKLVKKQEKKRQKRKRQKKRKEEAKRMGEAEVFTCNGAAGSPVLLSTDEPSSAACSAIPEAEATSCSNDSIISGSENSCTSDQRASGRGHKNGANCRPGCQACDLGYSSGCCGSSGSSREGSDSTCSDGFCNHDENNCAEKENKVAFQLKCNKKTAECCGPKGRRSCATASAPPISSTVPAEGSCDDCQSSQETCGKSSKKGKRKVFSPQNHAHCAGGGSRGSLKADRGNFQSRLLEMLKEEPDLFSGGLSQMERMGEMNGEVAGGGSEDQDAEDQDAEDEFGSDNEGLTAEEIAEFEVNRSRIHEERIVLREKIRKNFEQLCGKKEKAKSNITNGGGGASQSSGKTGKPSRK